MKTVNALLVTSAVLLTSCATTGDPNQGGLFGWSPSMANQRQVALKQHLAEVERDTAYQQGRSEALEDELARERRKARGY
ncbi:MAG: hypothetical protein ACOYMN_03245 [Roseimicrobium sp.]